MMQKIVKTSLKFYQYMTVLYDIKKWLNTNCTEIALLDGETVNENKS